MFKGVIPALQVMGQKVMASPTTQGILKTAKRSLVEAGRNVATDVLQGKNVGESLSENVTTAKRAVTDSLVSALDNAKVSAVGNTVARNKRAKKTTGKLTTRVVARKGRGRKKKYDLFDDYVMV
jgi:hypothetical protein